MPFSQQQLEDAYAQMQQERDAEYQNASQAADWLKQQLNMNPCNCWVNSLGKTLPSPFPSQFTLQLVCETYGPFNCDYAAKLNAMPAVRQLSPTEYEVDTPFGTFKVGFRYWNND